MKKLCIFISLIIGLLLAITATKPAVATNFALPSHVPLIHINREDVNVGDIVGQGIRNTDGDCGFGVIEMASTTINDGNTRWLGILLNAECQVVVNAKWEGVLDAGPKDVIEQLRKLLVAQTSLVYEETELPLANINVNGTPNILLTSGTKTSEQHVWMYGYGGSWDQLTHKNGKMTFSYTGSTATIISESGTCQGSSPGTWSWVVDGCVRDVYEPGPAAVVRRGGRGDYHCSPASSFPCNLSNPDGYYHSLYETEYGYSNGSSVCYLGSGGNIVAGVTNQILQGCN